MLTFQAEDEIAAMAATVGAAFAGEMAVTASSGPGIALKGEAMGLAVMTELPMVIVNVQRGGPSTGLPTKTEQADLFQAMFGRNGECPMPIIAARSPGDCFDAAIEAWRIAVRFMTPVMLLSDGYIANGSEPWRIPSLDELPEIPVRHPGPRDNGDAFLPYERNERLARPWAVPGTPGLEHRIGGLEKADGTGNVSYDPPEPPPHDRDPGPEGRPCGRRRPRAAARRARLGRSPGGELGRPLRRVCHGRPRRPARGQERLPLPPPLPQPLPQKPGRHPRPLLPRADPEINAGQLRFILRAQFLLDAEGLNKMQGKPFTVSEIKAKIDEMLA